MAQSNFSGPVVISDAVTASGAGTFTSVVSTGAISGTTGTFTGAVSGTNGSFSGNVTATGGTLTVGTALVTFGTSAPGAGGWYAGAIRFNSAPSAEAEVGWICTAAGTPGTWKAFGTLAA